MKTLAVIPARFASTRFPGKPLALLAGKPMVQHVWERCRNVPGIDHVIIATEDQRIFDAARSFGADCEITSSAHLSGTDRVAEIATRHGEFEHILNVQGDEPGIAPETVQAVAAALKQPSVEISTAVCLSADRAAVESPNIVKVVTDLDGRALYFSRAVIPFLRDSQSAVHPTYLRHLGIYGFQRGVLLRLTRLEMSPLEQSESLEQLRWLQSGFSIQCVNVDAFSIGVDTPHDLEALAKTLQS